MNRIAIYRACCYINFGATILFTLVIAYVLLFMRPYFEMIDFMITLFTAIAGISYICNDILGLQLVIAVQTNSDFSRAKRIALRMLFVMLAILQVILFIILYQISVTQINFNSMDADFTLRTIVIIVSVILLFLSSWGLLILVFPLLSQAAAQLTDTEAEIAQLGQAE